MMHLIAMADPNNPQSGMFTMIMFALMILIFWFMIIRPQSKQRKEREKMLASVKKGDKIVTAGGLHGTVAGTDEKTLLIQVADNVKLKFDRSAVAAIVREGEGEPKPAK